MLAAKCALSIRVDALGDTEDASVGMESRQKVCLANAALNNIIDGILQGVPHEV